jgi:hypothetical protein
MILISLMLASTPAPAVKPAPIPRQAAARAAPARAAVRARRLRDLEAAVNALPSRAVAESEAGPKGM